MNSVDSHITLERVEDTSPNHGLSKITKENLAVSSQGPQEQAFEPEGAFTDGAHVLVVPPENITGEPPTPEDGGVEEAQTNLPAPQTAEEQVSSPLKTGGKGNDEPPRPPKSTPTFEEEPEPEPRKSQAATGGNETPAPKELPPPEALPPKEEPPQSLQEMGAKATRQEVQVPVTEKAEQVAPPDTKIETRPEKEEAKQEPPTPQSKEITSVHYERDGIYFNKNPDATAQALTEEMNSSREFDSAHFRAYVDHAPNLNEKYADELELVKRCFEEEGLELAPIAVLDDEHFEEAQAIVGDGDTQDLSGGYLWERIILREPSDPQIEELFGKNFILGNMLHEGGHSSGGESKGLVVSRVLPNEEHGYTRHIRRAQGLSGFRKYKFEGSEIKTEGDFIEESFADLFRARALERLDMLPHAEEQQTADYGIRYLGEGATPPEDADDLLVMPLKFILAKPLEDGNGRIAIYGDISHIAAYGLSLLDEARPGLFDQMKLARNDPKKQIEVIKTINNIKPGLYKELRNLGYTRDDFIKGVKIIQAALAESTENHPE